MALSKPFSAVKSFLRPLLKSTPTLTKAHCSQRQMSSVKIEDFKSVLTDLIQDLTFKGDHIDMPEVNKHLSKCIEYNLTDGKLNRGMMVPLSLKLLVKNEDFNDQLQKEAFVLGWCIEFLQAFFLVADDMMDLSTTRRGKPCWYLEDNRGHLAINDAILLETSIYTLLDKYFRGKDYYLHLLDTFLYITRHTAMGQQLDIMSEKCTLEEFSMKRHSQIVIFKTSYYSFYLPVQCAMILAGIEDPEVFRQARDILLRMGHLFQVQDDFLDCYGDPQKTGKIGTDIQDGKCSWLIVSALQHANSKQKEILASNYGLKDLEAVEKVKAVYQELEIAQMYHSFEEDSYSDLQDKISKIEALNPQVFHNFLSRIYKREQ